MVTDHISGRCESLPRSTALSALTATFWRRNGVPGRPFPTTHGQYARARERAARGLASVMRADGERRPYRAKHDSLRSVPRIGGSSEDALDEAFVWGLGTKKR